MRGRNVEAHLPAREMSRAASGEDFS